MSHADSNTPAQPFLHGTKADLKPGDMIKVGYKSNFTTAKPLSWVYFTRTIEAATWGAELASDEGESTWWSRPDPSKTIPTSQTRNSPAIPRNHTVPANRFGSSAKSRTGSPIRPNSCSR